MGQIYFFSIYINKVVATKIGVKMETPKFLKKIPLPFTSDPNPRDSVPGKFCFLGFIKLVNL